MNIGVILAGGSGVRFGSRIPKQYQEINNKEVISYVIESFKRSTKTDIIIGVANNEYVDYIHKIYGITTIVKLNKVVN